MTDDTIETSHDPIPFPDREQPEPVRDPEPEPIVEQAPQTAASRLREFEDETFGKEATRIDGHVERGHGSMFQRMTAAQKVRYAALERLVKTEKEVADTSAKLAKAEADHEVAMKALDAVSDQTDGSSAE